MYPRFVKHRVYEALADTRVVLLCGPRQSGKTTLARQIAGDDIPFFTLDDTSVLEAASNDPVGFVRGLGRAVIDEVHRAPGLILAIKEAVDTDPQPGRFLLTGSANLMTLPHLADSLAGRMGIIRLLPWPRQNCVKAGQRFWNRCLLAKFLNPQCRLSAMILSKLSLQVGTLKLWLAPDGGAGKTGIWIILKRSFSETYVTLRGSNN